MEQNKELWPGAVLWLDFETLGEPDADHLTRIDEHLAGLPTTRARIDWMERCLIELDDAIAQGAKGRIRELVKMRFSNHPGHDSAQYAFDSAVKDLYAGIQRRLKKQRAIRRLEADQERAALKQEEKVATSPAPDARTSEQAAIEKTEPDDSPTEEFTTSRKVMLLYYLVVAANEGRAINKSALGRLLERLTGQKPSSTKRYWQNPTGKMGKHDEETEETRNNRAAVRAVLEDLGLPTAVDLLDREAN